MVPRRVPPYRPRVLRATAAAVVVAVGALGLASAAPAASTKAVPGASNHRLTLTTPESAAVRRLDGILPHASVGEVLGSGNRQASAIPALAPPRQAGGFQNGFRFASDDTSTTKFFPQGITGTADASATGLVDGRKALLVSWYARNPKTKKGTVPPGVRVSFIGAEKLTAAKYRHVLLVNPYMLPDGTADYRPTKSHAGGIAWVGRRLYVAETTGGLSVYDTARMWKVSATSGDKTKVGCTPNPCEAADYQYVMPKVAEYRYRYAPKYQRGALLFSSVSYDRASQSLMTSEYYSGSPTTKANGTPDARLVRWPLMGDGALRPGSGNVTTPTGLWTTTAENVQGALTIGNTVYVSSSGGDRHLYVGGLGGKLAERRWPNGGEDLTYAPASGRIYSVLEHPGRERAVVAVKR
ncbi:hypothetical protein AB0L40_24535 [Patulibacter sp. NPDC049589]|uniref:hypothetical protein n=1 Tax=Patulibacter sp. NPDC049589 TaxID=3154731 RepID=UPI003425CDDC